MLHRYAGADDQRVHALQQPFGVLLAQAQLRPGGLQVVQRAVEVRLRLGVADVYLRALQEQQLCHGDAAAGHAEYQYLFVFHHVPDPLYRTYV